MLRTRWLLCRRVMPPCSVDLLLLEILLLFLELVEKIGPFPVKLLRRELPSLELLHLLLAHVLGPLTLTKMLPQFGDARPPDLLFLQRDAVP